MAKKSRIPSTMILLFCIVVVAMILTYIVPAGAYERTLDEASGYNVVDPSSFQYIEKTPVNPFKMFVAIPRGFVAAANICFLISFGFFWIYSIMQSGALNAAIHRILNSKMKDSKLFIPFMFFIFAIAGSTYGELETVYGLIPVFVAFAIALGYDPLVGIGMCYVSVATGFASATTNAFTIGVAQTISELPMFSGLGLRWIIFFVFGIVICAMVMRYAAKVKADPTKSITYGDDFSGFELDTEHAGAFTTKHKIILLTMIPSIAMIVFGSLKLGWYINEMSAVFIISGLVVSIIAGFKPEQIKDHLLYAMKEMAVAMAVVGLARAIQVVLTDGNIIDTIVHAFGTLMQGLPAWLTGIMMLIVQNLINFFIPSGSGQAAAIMPIMAPLADVTGLSRQVAVLAYQFGDGYSNMIWPTASCAIVCGIAHIPLEKWYKFILPIFGVMFVMQCIFIIIATAIGY